MAFMALFGWIFLPVILLYGILRAVAAPLAWALARPGLVNAAAAGLLAGNLLLAALLLRARKRRKREGRGGRVLLLLAALWEMGAAGLCALFLAFQPLQYLPPGFGEPFSLENNCYGTWTVAACQGVTPYCTRSREEIEAVLGRQVGYGGERFASVDWSYALEGPEAYQSDMARPESFPSRYGLSLEDLGGGRWSLRHVRLGLPEEVEEDRLLGREFYVLDKNTLLLCQEGVFYRAERTGLPFPDRPERPLPPRVRDPDALPWFAAWKITECLGTDPENPMDPELVEKILQTELEFQAGFILFQQDSVGGGGFGDPAYKEAELTAEEFRSAFGVSLKDLGVEAETVLCVTAESDRRALLESLRYFVDGLGNRFLLLDGETLLLCGQGAFFRAELVPDSWPTVPDPSFELPTP